MSKRVSPDRQNSPSEVDLWKEKRPSRRFILAPAVYEPRPSGVRITSEGYDETQPIKYIDPVSARPKVKSHFTINYSSMPPPQRVSENTSVAGLVATWYAQMSWRTSESSGERRAVWLYRKGRTMKNRSWQPGETPKLRMKKGRQRCTCLEPRLCNARRPSQVVNAHVQASRNVQNTSGLFGEYCAMKQILTCRF
jgi:hypothetical protein